MNPTLILHNAKIYTQNPAKPWAESVAIAGHHILAVGENESILAMAGAGTEIIDLAGRLVLPGLCDAHIHLYDWSLSRRLIPLDRCRSLSEMLALIREWAEMADPRAWLTGLGWNESFWPEQIMPTRSDLDRVTGPEQPAIFWRADMHAAVANSAALKTTGIDASMADPEGGIIGRDEKGEPNGLLWELAINLVRQHLPEVGPADLQGALMEATGELHRLGVTAVHDQRMKDHSEGPAALAAYQELAQEKKLKLRINCNIAAHDLHYLSALGLRSGFGDDYVRLGHVKLFADGTMGSQTAWMLTPYKKAHNDESGYVGVSLTPPEQMADEIQRASAAGFPTSVHAIGDRANRVVLDIFEELSVTGTRLPVPNRIEHVQIIDPADLDRMAALNLTASVQPIHVLDDMDVADHVLGEQASNAYNFGGLARSGARLALGSDAPVADPNPFLGIHAAIFRQRPDQMASSPWHGDERLSLEQTIRGYTLGAAEAAGWTDVIGSIKSGKRADLIVLDRDLFGLIESGISRSEIADTKVVMTIFDGEIVYRL